ncbi:MAG: PAS domain-containing protein [Puniceicoccales bacterium]|jgi:signal transduction histidine kinase|nr:PAS domain-containing protein [Puniceicoccales bacterium]
MPLRKRQSPLDRLLGRADDLDPANLAILVQRIARERDLLETVFNTIQEGIIVMDAAGLIEYANRAAADLTGFRESDIGKAVFWKFVPALARAVGRLPDNPAAAAPVITREVEITYPEPRHVRIHLSRLGDASTFADCDAPPRLRSSATANLAPAPPRYVAILRDITAEKISTQDLVESERINSIFTLAAGVAHELGNPLNSINIHLQVMGRRLAKLRDKAAAARLAASVSICSGEISRLDGIIHHFLEAIRPAQPDLRDVPLLGVIAEVLALVKTQCEDLGIRVSVTTGKDLPVISGDANQLKQLFFNLLKNAMEAMDKGGRIDISADADDEFVRVAVRDTGVGIERDAQSRMFDPYFTTKVGGHGLGMMVVMRILRAHGGEIGVESAPGRGTEVTVQFPQKHRRVRLLAEDGR